MHAVMLLLERIAAPWASIYNDHSFLQATVAFAHIGGLLVGGGLAISMDRATLRASRAGASGRSHLLEELAAVHRPVLAGLAVTALSGVLLFAADVRTFATSPLYWGKIALVVLLLANGARLGGIERRLRGTPTEADWRRLRLTAIASLSLWMIIALAGTLLVNAGG